MTRKTGEHRQHERQRKSVPHYLRDLECLAQLTDTSEPPRQLYRARRQSAFLVVGDASGKGKGNAVIEQYGVDYESGAWNLEW